eukprot:1158546-Pelagomonas_calceolata.AAC.6
MQSSLLSHFSSLSPGLQEDCFYRSAIVILAGLPLIRALEAAGGLLAAKLWRHGLHTGLLSHIVYTCSIAVQAVRLGTAPWPFPGGLQNCDGKFTLTKEQDSGAEKEFNTRCGHPASRKLLAAASAVEGPYNAVPQAHKELSRLMVDVGFVHHTMRGRLDALPPPPPLHEHSPTSCLNMLPERLIE